MYATIAGLIKDLGVGMQQDEKHFFGTPSLVDYQHAPEAPPLRASYFLQVFCEKSQLMRNMLLSHLMRYDVRRENSHKEFIDGFSDVRSLVSFTAYEEYGSREFSIGVMLKKRDFANFADFVESHFSSDLEYLITVPFYGFTVSAENKQGEPIAGQFKPITKSEFYAGKAYLVPNGDVSIVFRNSQLYHGPR
jgi:hypothetical protein